MNPSSGPPTRLKVAQMVETMTMGGAENLAVRLANSLAEGDFESHLIVVTDPGILSERISSGVRVHYLNFHRASIKNPVAFLVSLFKGFRVMSSLAQQEGISLIQTHLPGANFWGLLLQVFSSSNIIATIHNNQEFRYGDHDSPWRSRFRKQAYRWIVTRCSGTIAVSADVKTSLVEDLSLPPSAQERITVIANGVEIPEPLPASERGRVRSQLGLAVDVPLILGAGRFGPQKNFKDLITAAKDLHDRGCSFQLLIAGEGEQLQQMKSLVRELDLEKQVHLPGNLQNLAEVMLAADFFAMTSLWEGLPLVLLEAMASGLPAVAYGIPGVNELVEPGVTGQVAAVGNVSEFADCLAQMLLDPGTWVDQGKAGKDLIRENYGFGTLVGAVSDLYRRSC